MCVRMVSVEVMNVERAPLNAIHVNKIRQLEDRTHIIAHNLRGAGGNIKMLAEVLQKKIDRNNKSDGSDDAFTIAEAIQYIYDSSSSLLNTLNTLMEVTDIELNNSISYDECNIMSVVENIAQQLRGYMHQKKAEIKYDLAFSTIAFPLPYMESILYNLINNSLKYARPGVPLTITVTTHMHNSKPVLSIKDNGLGIDLEKYSSRMFKLNQVFHSGYESKGIGLYITKAQIETMGGTIDVKSTVGEGSEFIVTF